jgi:para-nitrobenzyl esterase
VESWHNVRDATSFGPTCPKGDYPPVVASFFPEVVIPGEECLNLNVWTPDLTSGGLPVLVWIHGGSFTNGSGSVAEYRGTAFARDGVVCVTINYRLGAEGFLAVDGSENLGLLDQIAALEWVQDNIAKFGGDPDRVTVAGESAGAMSVTTLLSMSRTSGLFRRAVAQSGAGSSSLTLVEGQAVVRYLAEACGVPPTREALTALPVEQLTGAASALTAEVQTAADPAKWGRIVDTLLPFAPIVDGQVLEQLPLQSFGEGVGAEVGLLTGWNKDELRILLLGGGTMDLVDAQMLEGAASSYGLSAQGLAGYRERRPSATPGDVLAAVLSDWFFQIPAIRVAEARASSPGNTWLYRFDYESTGADGRIGASHGVELPFVFDTLDVTQIWPRVGTDPPQAVADTTHRIWVDFITNGDPGWPPYELATRPTALIDDSLHVANDPTRADRLLWEGVR